MPTDYNGDGYGDIAIADPGVEGAAVQEGGVLYAVYGTAAGVDAAGISLVDQGIDSFGRLGESMAAVGDVNGDGYGDVGAGYCNLRPCEALYLYYGSSRGLGGRVELASPVVDGPIRFGFSIAGGGDVDADGLADVVIGAPEYSPTPDRESEGVVFVFYGSTVGLEEAPRAVRLDDPLRLPRVRFGSRVLGPGDLDGDGFTDVAVTAGLENARGEVFVYLGAPDGFRGAPLRLSSPRPTDDAWFGLSGTCGGDVDGDGLSDLLVGEPQLRDAGTVWVYRGSALTDGLSIPEEVPNPDGEVGAAFGAHCAVLRDLEGDGYDDLIVTAPLGDSSGIDRGATFLFPGSPGGVGSSPSRLNAWSDGSYSFRPAAVGDVDGDGVHDAAIGSPSFRIDTFNVGRVYLYLGDDLRRGEPRVILDQPLPGARFGRFGDSVATSPP